jgi:NifU-like protein
MSEVYPKLISTRLRSLPKANVGEPANSFGKSAALECGTFVEFQMSIEPKTKLIEKVTFRSNGCGFMIAAAQILSTEFTGRNLTDLNALAENPASPIIDQLETLPPERRHCIETAVAALKDTFADFRQTQIEEFVGEKALICTCFGVTEETIEAAIKLRPGITVDRVGDLCRAGTGCGSCQMMIQEIIDLVS